MKPCKARVATLPKSVACSAGPVAVRRVANLTSETGEKLLGRWLPYQRAIEVEADDIQTTQAWLALWHEWTHAALFDAGVHLKCVDEERVCDAIALARTREAAR